MATSPLFGWEEPDDVDLVKDGAAAIRTLGNAIDTSMGDLLGGTSGQVLSKNSNTNMDFTWVTPDDANAIQNAIVDAKGDLIAATAADTPARLAVGTNGQILTADSTAATGLKWASASSGALTKITSASFSAVSDTGTTFDGIFTSTYTNYVVVFKGYSGTDNVEFQVQNRVGSTTQTGIDYYGGRWWVGYNGSTAAASTSGQTKWQPATLRTNANNQTLINMNITNVGTGSNAQPVFNATAGGGWLAGVFVSGGAIPTTTYSANGLIFSASSGTITGTIYVYGVQN
jgi:hypothetical protein